MILLNVQRDMILLNVQHQCFFDKIWQSGHSELYYKKDVTTQIADLVEYYMIEPLIVLNRSEAPENFTTERGVPTLPSRQAAGASMRQRR